MRAPADSERIEALARGIGRVARGHVRVYLTGGATAVLEGWRSTTVDVDVLLEPETDEVLRELVKLKERLGINVELASRPDFIPKLSGWRGRSPFLFREGNAAVHHFGIGTRRSTPGRSGARWNGSSGDGVAPIRPRQLAGRPLRWRPFRL